MKVYIFDNKKEDKGRLIGTEEVNEFKETDTPEFRRLCYDKYGGRAKAAYSTDKIKKAGK